MKEAFKMLGLVISGLLTAVIIYPFLHEGGHSIVAIMVGAGIAEFNLLPLPFVVCEVSAVDNIGQMLIGLGGIIIPFFASMSLKPKSFWMWYVNLLIKGISTYAALLSVIAIILHINGISWQNEDIVQVLQIFPKGTWLFLFVFTLLSVYGIIRIVKEKPLTKCIDYFDMPSKTVI